MNLNNCLQYKGYVGSAVYSEEDGVFHGRILGIKPMISYEGESVKSLIKDFRDGVDEYLEFCEQKGIQPEKTVIAETEQPLQISI